MDGEYRIILANDFSAGRTRTDVEVKEIGLVGLVPPDIVSVRHGESLHEAGGGGDGPDGGPIYLLTFTYESPSERLIAPLNPLRIAHDPATAACGCSVEVAGSNNACMTAPTTDVNRATGC